MHTMQLPAIPAGVMITNNTNLEAQMRTLADKAAAIQAAAAAEGRVFTSEEVTEIETLLAQFHQCEEQIEAHQKAEEALGHMVRGGQSRGRQTTPEGPGSTRVQAQPGSGIVVGETAEGKQIRAYAPHEPIAEWRQSHHDFSFQDWIRAVYSGDWSKMPRNQMSEQVGADGGWLVPGPLAAQTIEMVRNKMMVLKAGALTVPMDSNTLTFAKQSSDIVAHWRGELQPIVPSKPTIDKVTFVAHVVAGITILSEELIQDAPNAGAIVQSSLAAALALAVDAAALTGDGVGKPTGCTVATGVQKLTGIGAITHWGKFIEANGLLVSSNFQPTALVLNGPTYAVIDGFAVPVENQPLLPPPSWATYQHLVSNQLPEVSNTSTAVLGDFTQYWFGMRQQLVIEVQKTGTVGSTNLNTDLAVAIRAYLRVDGLPVRPEAFVSLEGITT